MSNDQDNDQEIVRVYDQQGGFSYAIVVGICVGGYVLKYSSGATEHLSQQAFFEKTQERALFVNLPCL